MDMNSIIDSLISHYRDFDFKIALMVLAAYFTLDLIYAKYILSVSSKNEYRAATFGVLVNILVALGVISYTNNWMYIFPLAVGSWFGTFCAVKKSKAIKGKVIKR
jgi:hypothetical protein